MTNTIKAKLWIALYILFVIAPVLILFTAPQTQGREFWRELSVAFGFAGMALMGLQFIPTARLPFLGKIFPMDTLYWFHHRNSIAGFSLALAHPLLLFIGNPYTLRLLNLISAPWRARAAVTATVLFILLIITSIWRKDLRMRYEVWHAVHDYLAIAAAALVLYHMFKINYYMAMPLMRAYWIFSIVIWAAATLYIRVIRSLMLLRRPYRLVSVQAQRGDAWTISLVPDGHQGFNFLAGQIAWLTVGRSPFTFIDNPFSFSSSAEDKTKIEFTIKKLGDFTSTIDQLQPGETVYVDGPFGTFDIDKNDAPGFVMIAGGIGSVPVMSILRTMADRNDQRPVIFFLGNPTWESISWREVYDELASRMNLKMVHVLEKPHEGWEGERGFITADVLDRHLGSDRNNMHYFICGPPLMINLVEKALINLGIPRKKIHTENYEMA